MTCQCGVEDVRTGEASASTVEKVCARILASVLIIVIGAIFALALSA